MGKQLSDPYEKINQRSIGFTFRQILFFADNPGFKPDTFCRRATNKQIKVELDNDKDTKPSDYEKYLSKEFLEVNNE